MVAALSMTGLLLGVGLAANTKLGIALLLALLFLPVVLTNFQRGLTLWFPVIFLEGLPAFNAAGKGGGLVIVLAWLAGVRRLAPPAPEALRCLRPLMFALAALLVFYACSLIWAQDAGRGFSDLWHWWAVALLMVIVATAVNTRRHLRAMCTAFVGGALLTVAFGIAGGELTASTSAVQTASEGRLEGGQGDPNFLAAGIVPAIILGLVLLVTTRRSWVRWGIAAACGLLALGLVASESRGGVVAAVLAMLAALVLFKRHRVHVLVATCLALGIATAWFAVAPQAWDRVSEFDNGGSGRTELWTIAWRMFADHPVQGVGLFNYSVQAPDYASAPGSLGRLDLIFDHAQVAHNVYLQALAETGVVGLGLFLAVAVLSMRAAWLAARRFRALGDLSTEMLARGIIVATIGLM
ncbi:MAG: O-antigen ligase family protein, partial [Solirubrobacterales bacterium]|nr:O-antigen ligase family protein [Solirubrobacterales bacterium]